MTERALFAALVVAAGCYSQPRAFTACEYAYDRATSGEAVTPETHRLYADCYARGAYGTPRGQAASGDYYGVVDSQGGTQPRPPADQEFAAYDREVDMQRVPGSRETACGQLEGRPFNTLTAEEMEALERCRGGNGAPPQYGTPPSTGGSGTVHVRGYYRRDGTYVRPHTRRAPRR